jgi:hypothetical protein
MVINDEVDPIRKTVKTPQQRSILGYTPNWHDMKNCKKKTQIVGEW